MSVWLLMSHRAGDNSQLLALAEALELPYVEKRLSLRQFEFAPRIILGATLRNIDLEKSSALAPPWPELVILASRPAEGAALWIKRQSPATKLVFIGTPWAGLDRFDLVITTPQYRLPERANVLHNALPLHNVWPERLAAEGERWKGEFTELPEPRIAVLVGGRTGPYLFEPSSATRLGREASARAKSLGGSLLVTTSARTSPAASAALVKAIDVPCYFHQWQRDDDENPFHGILGAASEVIVTADSVSMIAEACATGKPTFLFDIEEGPRSMRAPVHWKGGDFASTLWRLGLKFGPDWWTRDIRIVHRAVVERGLASWLGDPAPKAGSDSGAQDMDRALARVRSLLETPRRIV